MHADRASERARVRSERFRPTDRVRRRSDYRRVQRAGARVHTRSFVLLLAPAATERTRLGVTVTRKIGNAVLRNRIKRLTREVFRRNREVFPEGCDVVVIAKRGMSALDYGAVRDELWRARGALRTACAKARRGSPP